jgi:hypothetical protein
MAWLDDGRGSLDPVEPVVPLCEQFSAQHNRAAETSGLRLSAWAAFLQQSMPAIPGIVHSCSLECSGMPAKTLPLITRINANDAKRVTMPSPIYGSQPTFVNASLNRNVESIKIPQGFAPSELRQAQASGVWQPC